MISTKDNIEMQQKTVNLTLFYGSRKYFTIWWKRFYTYATIKTFASALDENFSLPDDPNKLDGTDGQKETDRKNLGTNDMIIACLINGFPLGRGHRVSRRLYHGNVPKWHNM